MSVSTHLCAPGTSNIVGSHHRSRLAAGECISVGADRLDVSPSAATSPDRSLLLRASRPRAAILSRCPTTDVRAAEPAWSSTRSVRRDCQHGCARPRRARYRHHPRLRNLADRRRVARPVPDAEDRSDGRSRRRETAGRDRSRSAVPRRGRIRPATQGHRRRRHPGLPGSGRRRRWHTGLPGPRRRRGRHSGHGGERPRHGRRRNSGRR